MTNTTDEPVVDAQLVEHDEHPEPTVTAIAGAALERREVRNEVIRPLDRHQVVEAMQEHQALLRDILDPSDWQGPPDREGSFVKKSGWRKIALSYNLTVERVHEVVERDEEGKPLRASYTARATAPNGRGMEATGHCSFSESRFSGPRGNQSKLENDMRATAETRAKNRAISDLIGMGRVSAEEVDAGSHTPALKVATPELRSHASRALTYLLANDVDAAEALWGVIKKACDGNMPEPVAQALVLTARAVKEHRTAATDAPPDTEGLEPEASEPGDEDIPWR